MGKAEKFVRLVGKTQTSAGKTQKFVGKALRFVCKSPFWGFEIQISCVENLKP